MTYESQDVAKPQQLRHDDIVMILMGATGTGKSHVIDTLTGQNGRLSGTGLECVTKYVTGYRIQNHPKYGSSLVCVDTPGFDDTHLSDMEILEMISEWLLYMHRRNIPLAGIFYLHRITDNRMGGTPLRNLRIFTELCGDAARNAVLVTTMWDKLTSHAEGERREESLKKNYWHGMIQHGAFVDRFENTFKSAWDVVGTMVARSQEINGSIPLLIQEELVIQKKRLEETRAGRAMYRCLQDHLSKRQEAVQLLSDASKYQSDENINSQLFDLQKDIEKILREVDRLHISFGRRLFHFILDNSPSMRPLSSRFPLPLPSTTLAHSGRIDSVISNVNRRRALVNTVQPQEEDASSRLPAGARESWICVDFNTSQDAAPAQQTRESRPEESIPVQREPGLEEQLPADGVSDEAKLEHKPSQAHIDFVEPAGLAEPKVEEKPKFASDTEHSDAEGPRVGDTNPRKKGRGRTQFVTSKAKARSRSWKARSKSPARTHVGQIQEIISSLPENVQGDLHLHFTLCPVTHIHGSYHPRAPPTTVVPQVGNVTFLNSNNTCTCAHRVAEPGGGEANGTKNIPVRV